MPTPLVASPKSQVYVAPWTGTPGTGKGLPGLPGTGAPLAVKTTSWLIAGFVGEKLKFAVFAGSVVDTVIVLDEVDVALLSLVTVIVMVNVPPRA